MAHPEEKVYFNAHAVKKGDVRIDGPYLDDVRAAEEDAYREARYKANKAAATKKKGKKNASEGDE